MTIDIIEEEWSKEHATSLESKSNDGWLYFAVTGKCKKFLSNKIVFNELKKKKRFTLYIIISNGVSSQYYIIFYHYHIFYQIF